LSVEAMLPIAEAQQSCSSRHAMKPDV